MAATITVAELDAEIERLQRELDGLKVARDFVARRSADSKPRAARESRPRGARPGAPAAAEVVEEGSHADWQSRATEIFSDGEPHSVGEIAAEATRIRPATSYGTIASWVQRQARKGSIAATGERGSYVLRSEN